MSENCEISVTENTTGPIVDLDCGEGANPDVGKDICAVTDKDENGFGEDTEKPSSFTLSLGDELTSEIDSSQGDKLEVGNVMPGDDGDGSYYILVSDDDDPSKLDKVYFSGDVGTGQSFTANGIDGKFGSETYVHIFSSDGGTLLQTINFHTSCSAPLVIGDQYGSITLEGAALEGKDSGTIYTVGATETDGDAGVVYEITGGNDADDFTVDPDTGVVTFLNPPDFENPTDSDGDNKYDVEVTAFFVDAHGSKTGEVCEVKPLEVCVEDDCINVLENTSPVIADLDCGEGENPDVGKDICAVTDKDENGFGEDTEKPSSFTLSLGDELTSEIDSSQGDKLEVGNVMPGDDGDGSYYILVSDDDDPSKLDKVYFSGDVGTGQSFTANGIDGKFGSETYVHIFSSDGGTLLQTINFHTSCSAPLVIGDQYGSITLEGAALEGKDSGTIYTVGATETDGDAGVVYEITGGNDADDFTVDPDTGVVTFLNPPDFENPTDSDGDNKYDVEVTAFFVDAHGSKTGEVCEVKPLEVCVEDDCINVLENTSPVIADLDCGEGENPDVGKDICAVTDKDENGFGEDTEKPSSFTLSLGDELTSEIDSSQGDKLEVGNVMPGDDGDGSYYILVSDDDDPSKLDKVYFSGDVGTGQSFTANGIDGKFGSETYIHIFSSDGGTLLQTINFHTSCSAPLVIGDQYGSITLEGAALEGKDSGTIYTVGATETDGDAGVVYEITGGNDADDFTVDPDTGVVTFLNPPDFENPTDSDGDNKYDVEVTAFFVDAHGSKTGEVCEVKPLEVCVDDQDCIEILENTTGPVTDLDATVDCEVETPGGDMGLFVCQAIDDQGLEKPSEFTLTLGDVIDPKVSDFQPDGKSSVVTTSASENGDGLLRVIVSDDEDPAGGGSVYFDGAVSFGDSFTALASNAGDDKFSSNTYVHILDDDGTPLQTIQYHTSCSAPIVIGDQVGSVTVTGVGALNKDTGQVVSFGGTTMTPKTLVEGEIVYSIVGGDDAGAFTVDPDTGEVSFINPPDFEASSVDGDDNYEVIVRATAKNDPDCFTDTPVEICVKDVVEVGSISGRYFVDNAPGDQDTDCDGLDNDFGGDTTTTAVADQRVVLFKEGVSGPFASTFTDENGEYAFTGLEAGNYRVRFIAVDGKEFTEANVGGDDAIDSDVTLVGAIAKNGNTDFFPLAAGETVTDVDAGVCELASLGDKVFFDLNRDGIQDAGEAGVAGVTVTLTGGGADGDIGTPDDTTDVLLTDANGEYLFEDLDPGTEYKVTFSDLPPGTELTPIQNNETGPDGDAGDSDADPANGMTDPVVLAPGEINTTVDAGVVLKLGALSGRYFCDTNDNDVDDGQAVDPGVARVLVTLLDANGAPVLDGAGNSITTTTDSLGNYSFGGLEPGTYGVQFDDQPDGQGGTVLAGKVLVDPNVDNQTTPEGTGDEIDSDAVGDTETSTITGIVVTPGDETADNDAGAEKTAALGDFVFEDDNADGIQDAGEAGIGDVGVTLTGGGDDGLISTAGDNDTFTTTTDSTGFYQFTGLNPGEEYQVSFDTPAGFVPSPVDAGTDDTVDSDGDPADGLKTDIVTLTSGENDPSLDQGFYELASLGDRVFEDTNGDGIQGDPADEPGVDNVLVELLDGAGQPVLVGGVAVTATTDANGDYLFEDLVPGEYQVRFTPPAGFGFTTPNQGLDDAADSDADLTDGTTQTVTLVSGDNNLTLDAGLVQTASLGDFVFEDDNADGIQDAGEAGIGDVVVTLTGGGDDGLISTAGDNDTFTTTTDSTGFYQFTGLNPGEEYQVSFDTPAGFVPSPVDAGTDDAVDSDGDPADGLKTDIVTLTSGETNPTIDQGFYELASLGDRVFEDTNGDGIQGDPADEPGVDNVTVKLFKDGADTGQTTTTDANGAYSFTGLVPGTYSVMFVAPAGFAFTTANAAGVNDALDSDANPANGMTDEITLSSGEFNGTLDAGLVQTNNPPAPEPDVTKFCADDITGVDVLANDTDPDGDALSIVTVGGIAPDANGQVLLSGTAIVDRDGTVSSESFTGLSVTVQGDNLVIDADAAFAFLDIGEEAEVSISYSVSDGNGGTGSTELVATICGEANSLASLVDSLPDSLTYEVVVQGGGFAAPSAFELKVLGPAGSPLEGVVFEQAYCLSYFETVPTDGTFNNVPLLTGNTVNPEPFTGSALSGTRGSDLGTRTGNTDVSTDAADNLDFINWIMAEEFHLQDNGDGGNETYTEYEVQLAIWEFTDSAAAVWGGNGIAQKFEDDGLLGANQPLGTLENVDEIVQAALASGDGFEAGDGDVASFIIDPTNPSSNQQPFIVAFDYDEYDCIC